MTNRAGVLLLCAAALSAGAQRGSGYSTGSVALSRRVEAVYLAAHASDTAGGVHWFQVVVLWRGQPDWPTFIGAPPRRDGGGGHDTTGVAEAVRQYNAARKAALMDDAVFFGGQRGRIAYFARLDSARRSLTVLDRVIRVPPRDSALVVLVDRVDQDGGPRVIEALVVDGRYPAPVEPRHWQSGDTLFTIRVPDRTRTNLEDVLSRDTRSRTFWSP